LDVEPEVWRRFVVSGDITLDRLHDVIQIVMGWTDSHLHSFTVGKKRYTERPEPSREGVEECRHRLVNHVKKNGRAFEYWYEFGDDWIHEIKVENSRYCFPDDAGFPLPWCIGGENACPPEDVGGPPGYQQFLAAVTDPEDLLHEEYKSWSGEYLTPVPSIGMKLITHCLRTEDGPEEGMKTSFRGIQGGSVSLFAAGV